ncbi:S1 family peptidase [Actinoalloteichus fjordicus]
MSAVVLLAAGTTAGLGTAAAADSTTDDAALSPGLVTAMAAEFGIDEQQAEVRLAQEAAAMTAAPVVEEAAGAAFGGSWFDPASGDLIVGLSDPSQAAEVRTAGVRTVPVEHSLATLDAAKNEIDALSRTEAAPLGIAGWRVDLESNRVVVDVVAGAEGPEVDAFLEAATATGPVTIAEVAEGPETFAAGTVGGDPYIINGNTRCSIGFSVQGGFVTAGHCGTTGSSVRGWDGTAMGSFAGSSFPGNDYGWVRIGNGWWTEPVVLGWGTVSDVLVRGSNVAPVGSSICRSGSTTGWHCGTVQAFNVTVNYSQGAVHQMTQTSVCAEPGDSGGSYITGDQAQGVTSGGSGNCSTGGRTFFQPLNEILSVYGLRLVTA